MIDERHEIIKFSPNIPVKIFMHKLGVAARHWHKSLELLLVLDGEIEITLDGEKFILENEDIILINSNSIHEIHSQSAVMIAIQMDLSMFAMFNEDPDKLVFECNSTKTGDKSIFSGIQYAVAQMVRSNTHRNEGTDYENIALSYYLISQLMVHFRIQETDSIKAQKKYMKRLTNIVDYIQEHYQDNFTLSNLADSQELSVPYLSSFFNKYMGINFSQYYTNVKLEHAVSELLNTTDSIETIAINNGFTESHAFVRAFKKKYHMLPSAYRKQQADQNETPAEENLNYLLVEPSNYLHLLTKYLPRDNAFKISESPRTEKLEIPPVSVTESLRRLKHTFKKFITVGRASELLDRNIQEMLKDIQQNVGYEYIKFHGILSDDMMVCFRQNGQLHFRYTLVDMALDFLQSIGLKPLIQFSFMPMALASEPEKTIFQQPFNTSAPADMEEWNLLIHHFTSHLMERYGKAEVSSWLFCVWNEPVTSRKMFGFGDDKTFFDLYCNTYQTVKSVCPDFIFGSTSMLYMENHGEPSWIKNYLTNAEKAGCRPQFLNIHYYSDIIPPQEDYYIGQAPISQFSKRTDDFGLFIGSIRKIFRSIGYGDLPIYLTEWNFTLSHRNLLNDTCFKSCYILKNLLKNYDRLDSFGYWSLTDLLMENSLPQELFHGGLGIYTMNGLRKSVFYSFYFANRLGDELLAADDGYFITKKENRYQIITYNYLHYGDLFAAGEQFDITQTSRYSAFNMSRQLEFTLCLKDLANGRYEVREYFVNRHHGSAFDLWVGFGGIPLNPHDTDLLKGLCVPGFHSEYKMVEQETLDYQTTLEPLEIRLTEITPIDM